MGQWLLAQEIFRILAREMPEDVLADGSPSAYFVTSDLYSAASGLENAYTNLSHIWNNILPDRADENISNWEQTLFFYPIQNLPTLAERQARAIAKLRQTRGITFWDIITFVCDFLPGVWIEVIVPNKAYHGTWTLDVSSLDIDCYLGSNLNQQWIPGQPPGDFWLLGVSRFGVNTRFGNDSLEETTALRYSYQVNIYDGGLTPTGTLNLLDLELSAAEPARSTHTILNGFSNPPGYTTLVPNCTRFSTFKFLKTDPTSTSGYQGAF